MLDAVSEMPSPDSLVMLLRDGAQNVYGEKSECLFAFGLVSDSPSQSCPPTSHPHKPEWPSRGSCNPSPWAPWWGHLGGTPVERGLALTGCPQGAEHEGKEEKAEDLGVPQPG